MNKMYKEYIKRLTRDGDRFRLSKVGFYLFMLAQWAVKRCVFL